MKKLITSGFLFLYLFKAGAQENKSYEYSVKQCIEYAFTHQAGVLNAALDEEIARARVKEIAGAGLPQVSASFDIKDFIVLPTSLIPAAAFAPPGAPVPAGEYIPVKFGTKYNATAGFDVSQLIFDGSYLVGLQTTMVYLDLSRKAVERSKTETAVAVSKAYYATLVNGERMKLLDVNTERLKKLLDDTKALHESGFVEKIDLDRIRLSYNNLVSEKQKVEKLFGLSYYLLKFQMGMDLNAELKLTDKLTDADLEDAALLADGKFDYTRRIEYSLLQTQEKMQRLGLRKERFSRLPSIVAYGSFSSQAYRDKFDIFSADRNWYGLQIVGAKITLPVFSGLQRHYRIQQSKIAVQKIQNDMEMLARSIDLDLRAVQVNYQNSVNALKVQKENMELANNVVTVSKLKYEQGVGSNLEVINAEASLKEAQTSYYNALYEAWVAKIELNRANGNIKF